MLVINELRVGHCNRSAIIDLRHQRLKGKSATRTLPMPSAVLDAGFLDFVEDIRARSHPQPPGSGCQGPATPEIGPGQVELRARPPRVRVDLLRTGQPDPGHLRLAQLARGAPVKPAQGSGLAAAGAPQQGQQQVVRASGVQAALLVPPGQYHLQDRGQRLVPNGLRTSARS